MQVDTQLLINVLEQQRNECMSKVAVLTAENAQLRRLMSVMDTELKMLRSKQEVTDDAPNDGHGSDAAGSEGNT